MSNVNLKIKIMSWNHRILAHESKEEVYFQIHEVYYTDNKPDGYTANAVSVGGDTLKSINWTLNKMKEAIKKPVLWSGEKFPNECKVKYTCDLCGRNTFDVPSPHKCKGGFRKRGLSWSLNCH
jgi:hypothetical protein